MSHYHKVRNQFGILSKAQAILFLLAWSVLGSVNHVYAQRISWGVMWNGATVPIPEAIRYRTFTGMPAGSRGTPTIAREASTALIGGWGFHTYTRLYEINPEMSIGLMANPMIAVYYPANFGNGLDPWAIFDVFEIYGLPVMMQMPLMVHFASGMLSTSASSKDIGFGFSAGVEGSLFADRYIRSLSGEIQYDLPDVSWVRPAIAAHLRYWSRNDRPREFSFQFSTHRDNYTGSGVLRPMFKVSYGGYWNY